MLTESCEKVAHKFYCANCNYNTSRKSSYDKHNLTAKHLQLTNVNNKLTESCEKATESSSYICHICDKEYKSRVGLWKHSKNCKFENKKTEKDEITDKELIMMLIKDNSEFKNIMMEVIKSCEQICKSSFKLDSFLLVKSIVMFLKTFIDVKSFMKFVSTNLPSEELNFNPTVVILEQIKVI